MLESFSQIEIAERLGVSQPTVSRDMGALDRETERVSMFARKVAVEESIVWNTYLQIDMVVRHAFENYVKIEGSDFRGRLQALQMITSLLGKKVYLLLYTGFDLPDEHRDNSERQYVALRKELEEIRRQVFKPHGSIAGTS